MFRIVWLSLTLWLVATVCLTRLSRGAGSGTERPTGWRRTAIGWEESSRWQLDAPPARTPAPTAAVHPLVIASLELLVSVGALAAASPVREKLD